MPTISDSQKFQAALEPTLRAIGLSPRDGEFKTGNFTRQARSSAGLPDEELTLEYIAAAEDFLWSRVRCGLLRPVGLESGGQMRAGQSVWVFTAVGKEWRASSPAPFNPYANDFAEALLARFPFLVAEPHSLIAEARQAWLVGLSRAPMFLIGLLNEHLLTMLFDKGRDNAYVTDTNASRNASRAWAIQKDVSIGLSQREAKQAIPKGSVSEWDSLVNTLRDYRNKCAHEAAYTPSQQELAFAFLSLTRLAELVEAALAAFK